MDIHNSQVQESDKRLNLFFSIRAMYDRESSATSKEFKMGCYALVRFKFHYTSHDGRIATSVSFKLQSLEAHSKTQIKVTCNVDGAVIQSTVCQQWTDFLDMQKTSKIFYGDCKAVFVIPIEITVAVDQIPIEITDDQIPIYTSIPSSWSNLYSDDSFTDFHLSSETGTVPVHRVVMAHHSEVFKTMLNGEWKETAKHCLEVEGVSQQTLQHLKDYMYLGSLPEHEDLRPLLLIAKCYMMQHLEKACSDKLARSVTAENYRDTLEFAMDNRLQVLMCYMVKYVSAKVVDDSGALTYPPAAPAEAAKEKKEEEPEE